MNEQVEKILAGIDRATFETVARGALNDDTAILAATPEFEEINATHNDLRTIGIVKITGSATSAGQQQTWSSVVKIIDTKADSGVAAVWVFPEIEEKVYELALLTDDGLPLRPARCYLAQTVEERFKLLWLEDLSDAPQPPWALEHFMSAANHLGQFNGYHSVNNTELPIELPCDIYHVRGSGILQMSRAEELVESKDIEFVRRLYRDTPVEAGTQLAVLFELALEKAKTLPHGLCFGDSHARNMFPFESETVGIDWASLTIDPTGVDIGVLIGSALSWGVEEAQTITQNESAIFDSYVSGLESAGWTGDVQNVRLAFFGQFTGYLVAWGTMPIWIGEYANRMEKRLGVSVDEIPEHIAPVIALIPGYVDELKQLLN